MAPAVTIVSCLLATISCLTTVQSTTSLPTPAPTTTTTTPAPTSTSPTPAPTSTSPTPAPTTTTPVPTTTTTTPAPTTTTTTIPPSPAQTATSQSGVTNATSNTTTAIFQALVYGSCANPDLCCSGLNSSCHRLNCYCDVACLRFKDCCPDFKPTCLTVHNATNDTQPNTLTLTGTCSELKLCCSGTNYNCFRGCFCDEVCKQLNDCCPDLNSTCNFNTTTTAPPTAPFNSTKTPFNSTTTPSFNSTTTPFNSTATPPKVLTVLEVKVKILLPEEDHQAALLKAGTVLENIMRANNTNIYFKVIKIKRVS